MPTIPRGARSTRSFYTRKIDAVHVLDKEGRTLGLLNDLCLPEHRVHQSGDTFFIEGLPSEEVTIGCWVSREVCAPCVRVWTDSAFRNAHVL